MHRMKGKGKGKAQEKSDIGSGMNDGYALRSMAMIL